MAENKRYYWFKMKTDFYDNMIIKYLRTLKNGDTLVVTLTRIMLLSLKTDGYLKHQGILPTFEEEIALLTGEKLDMIKYLISSLVKFGAIEKQGEDTYYIKILEDNIGSESESAIKKRKEREKDNVATLSRQFPPEIEKESEKEKDIDKEKKTASSFSNEKKGGSFKQKNNFYKNYSKERKDTSYDIAEFMQKAETEELVYDFKKRR